MSEYRYDPHSSCADEFINHQEILDTLEYADAHKDDMELIHQILQKAKPNLHPDKDHCSVLTHREASVLLACEDPWVNQEIKRLAHEIKLAYYGNRIVLFAPLYLSSREQKFRRLHRRSGCGADYCPDMRIGIYRQKGQRLSYCRLQ